MRRLAAPPSRTPAIAAVVAALIVASGASAAHAQAVAAPPATAASAPPSRYTFGWPVGEEAPRPRGGTTRGPAVTLDREPSPAWQALQAPGLSAEERDRRAILAMAGGHRVTFDFLEVDSYAAAPGGARARAPYQSWATEKVYVDRDEPGRVSLVHILEMRIVGADGAVSAPFVTRHWRQDWAYEPTEIVEHAGNDRWRRRALAPEERRGAWRQTVSQVDESPRYASVGRWQHNASFSTWLSAETWRPLPRREWSVRGDYQVLVGTNRHTVGSTGWVQEENNLKAVLTAGRTLDPARPYVGREYGVARYERLRDADFALADRSYAATRVFWDRVRDAWASAFARGETVTLKGSVDKQNLFVPLFEHAARIESAGPTTAAEDRAAIDASLAAMGVDR